MTPGTYLAIMTEREDAAVEGRLRGLELRDTILVLRPGPRSSFVFLFRAPLAEPTVAKQVAVTGTGAIHVDACRVAADMSEFFSGTGRPRSGLGHAHGYGMGDGYGGDRANPPHDAGRWPSNLVLVHGTGCRRVGTYLSKKGVVPPMKHAEDRRSDSVHAYGSGLNGKGSISVDEVVAAWECDGGCPVRWLDEQSGDRRSSGLYPSNRIARDGATSFTPTQGHLYEDRGGASRYYPQFANDAELLAWVGRLINPPSAGQVGFGGTPRRS
jgi:hypothetical protein